MRWASYQSEWKTEPRRGVTPGLFAHSPFFFPGIWSIATDWKPTGWVLADESDGFTLPRSPTGLICPLGVERPSNITQPFDLSTPTRPFGAVMDGFLCVVQVSWFIDQQILTFFFFSSSHPSLFTTFGLNPLSPVSSLPLIKCSFFFFFLSISFLAKKWIPPWTHPAVRSSLMQS